MSDIKYTIIRSARRTLSLEITHEMQIIVRAPYRASFKDIDQLVNKHASWIEKHLEKRKKIIDSETLLTPEQEEKLKKLAKDILPVKTRYFATKMGVSPISIKITSAKKRFGSCSAKNGICYSWHLMEYPEAAIDYVVVHELAHIKHKNHGKEFYAQIEKYLPDFKDRIRMLKS